ncbi:uncharacterized protein LOC128248097 [Octopus bimaculoides]|uniref:uncharacterized protein LOC128248097 n=1 Tax=Octopus bimaculoides TaxID=37653 RepID=UPI0022E58E36|nr:uncharacterized protein LOC128248097 [Octopus bimaculoides]
MSRRKQSNPRPLLDFNRKKSPDASTQDQTSVHVGKFELQKSNGYVVAKSDEEPHAPLLMDAKNINSPAGVQLSSLPEHFILAPSKPSTSAGSNNCSPSQTTLSKHQLKMDLNAAAGKGKKSKIPAKRKNSGKVGYEEVICYLASLCRSLSLSLSLSVALSLSLSLSHTHTHTHTLIHTHSYTHALTLHQLQQRVFQLPREINGASG